MFDENDPLAKPKNEIQLGCDLSTFSIEDLDERVAQLKAEIERLQEEKTRKAGSLEAANAFFKK